VRSRRALGRRRRRDDHRLNRIQHLLVLSMLQHPNGRWSWGRFVVAYAAGNTDDERLCARSRDLLVDGSTFAPVTIEELLASRALPAVTVTALRARYVDG
jgi:hypothetical protein